MSRLHFPSAFHVEMHRVGRIGWLRAAVLGANDGIVSTASLIVGVAAASADRNPVILAGAAGLAAGAFSMAAGEYVSVSSQADTEHSGIAREREELSRDPVYELDELTAIYESRGISADLARQVAEQLTKDDALAAHVRDELQISSLTNARPLQAAIVSALTFSSGAAVPLATAALAPWQYLSWAVTGTALVCLATLGAVGARAGDAPLAPAVGRVLVWGALALAVTAGVGSLFGA